MKMKDMKITFSVKCGNSCIYAEKNSQKMLECNIYNGEIINCDVYYDFNERPLTLRAVVSEKDVVEIILMSHRIELKVNQRVCDEQWPAGNRYLDINDEIKGYFVDFEVEEYTYKEEQPPSVIDIFYNAEGWRPEKNVFVGDCMPYVNGDRYHVMYLRDRNHHRSKWDLGAHQWAHISTTDFNEWQIHPIAVPITKAEDGSICTGSWIKNNDIEYLFYTVRKTDASPALILRRVSDDGYHFEKDESFSFCLSEKYNLKDARDPKVIKGDDGLFHMFLTTHLVKENRGCLAHLVSENLHAWKELEEPIYISDDNTPPECPDYIKFNGYYYLILSLWGESCYMYSKNPFDGWKKPQNSKIACGVVPKGAVWEDKIVFAGFKPEAKGRYGGGLTFKKATNDENGILIFE